MVAFGNATGCEVDEAAARVGLRRFDADRIEHELREAALRARGILCQRAVELWACARPLSREGRWNARA